MIKVLVERKRPPQEYVEWLVRCGGRNRLYGPNFIIFWGETRTVRVGHGEMLQGLGLPCWMLGMWYPPEDYGPPTLWDYDVLGPYPSRGFYEIVQPMYWREGKVIHPMPLNYRSLELMLPILQRHRYDTLEQRCRVLRDERDKRDKELTERIADCLQDAVPIGEMVSYNGQVNRTSVMQRKMEEIERAWSRGISPTPVGPTIYNPEQPGDYWRD